MHTRSSTNSTASSSRRRTLPASVPVNEADYRVPKGAIVHVDPARPPPASHRRPSITAREPLMPGAPLGTDKQRDAELQRHQRAPSLASKDVGVAGVPRYVAPRPSITRGSTSSQPSSNSSGNASRTNASVSTPSASTTKYIAGDTRSMTREAQEEMRQREIERLNAAEEAKAQQQQSRRGPTEREIAAAAADANHQLGQPSYVAIATQKAAAEAQYEEDHTYTHLVTDLHQRLGVLPAPKKADANKEKKAEVAEGHKRLSSPANVVEDVTDKVLALRRAEMAEMVARLRRLLAEGNVTATPGEIPILPAAGVIGTAATSPPCPACDVCIELSSEEVIAKYLIPILKAIASERVVMPMAGRRGSVSITSSAASDSASTLDTFRVHSSRKNNHNNNDNYNNSARNAQQLPGGESDGPSRYAVPRCFRIELVPFSLRKVSIHVSVQDYVAEHFFKAHAQRQERLFSLAINPPYPETWSEWTMAHKMRLLHRVLDDLLHGGPHPPVPSAIEDVVIFPAHVDATRDALWTSVWSARSFWQLLTVPEDAIASYFGTEVMFYYAWMNHYARWLLGAGVLGLVVSLLSAVRLVDPAVMSGDYAAPTSAFAAFHFTVRRYVQHSLDAALLPVFITVMIVGSVLCIKTWERRCSFLTMKYHLFQQEGKDEPRRDFHGTPGRNPVTGEPQLVYPAWYRAMVLQPAAWAIVVLFMAGTIGIMVCSLNLDGMVSDPHSRLAIPFLRKYTLNGNVLDATAHPYLAMIPRIGYSVCIATLSAVFTELAKQLTRMENYRYRGEFVRALTLKRVVFEFVNSYAKLIFIAFGRSSMPELASNLQSILYVAVLSRLLSDTVLPFFVTHRQRVARRILQHQHEKKTSANADGGEAATALVPHAQPQPSPTSVNAHGGSDASPLDEVDEMLDPYDVYVDFIEMIIQFGYILLFAAAYPLASFVALLSNIIEVRSDLFKMCYVVRRPVPRLGLQENATWCGVMRVFAMASVITNTFLLAFTSHQMARWFPEYYTTANYTTAVSVAVPYGSSLKLSNAINGTATSAASLASLANAADGASAGVNMVPGTGRVVMFYAMVMEHVMGLVAAFLLWRIPSTPRVVRHYIERKMYERMSRS